MPKNYSAYLRYKIIDECLRNNYHPSQKTNEPGYWTLEEIAEKCWEEIGKRPSERTLKQDILRMRSGELGFEAPIENEYGIGYSYADTNFSIHKMPLYESEVEQMTKSLNILKHFKGMSYYDEIQGIIKRLKTNPEIKDYFHYEPVGIIEGYQYFDILIEAFEKKTKLQISYQPFVEPKFEINLSPGLIKEFNNRWYFIGIDDRYKPFNIALDRIKSAKLTEEIALKLPQEIIENQRNIIGVTVPEEAKVNIIKLRVNAELIPYFKTKPWHSSQIIIEENLEFSVIELKVMINIELKSRILSFGDGIVVERPSYLKKLIKKSLESSLQGY
jgi:predicted DNA-binding transcriptional regulator YafY